jgi:hypothetical protein
MKSTAHRPGIPEALNYLLLTQEGDRLNAVFKVAYASGWTLQELAEVIGVSREAVRLRINRTVPVDLCVEFDGLVPSKPSRSGQPPKKPKPIEAVPPSILERIKELQEASSGTNAVTPVGDPKRIAGDELCNLLIEAMTAYGVSPFAISKKIGLNPRTLKLRLAMRGYLPKPPSARTYQNKPRTYARKTHCKYGHERIPENLTSNNACRKCASDRAKKYYQDRRLA